MNGSTDGQQFELQTTSLRDSPYTWSVLWFPLHLAAVYAIVNFATPWLSGWTRERLLPLLGQPTSSGGFEFLFSHLFAFSFIPAFLSGLINARFKHKAAQFIWLVPTAVLAYKVATFPSSSVLQNHFSSAFHEYLGGGFLIPEFRDWREFWSIASSNSDMTRGMIQLKFTAPFYAGIAYSAAAAIGIRLQLNRKVEEEEKGWGQSNSTTGSANNPVEPPLG